MFENGTFGDLGGGRIFRGRRDLFGIFQDLPTLLQTSPGTNGMPENLLRPERHRQAMFLSYTLTDRYWKR